MITRRLPQVLRRLGRWAAVTGGPATGGAPVTPPVAWLRTRKCGEDGGVSALLDRVAAAAAAAAPVTGDEYTTLSGVVGGDI